MSGRISCRTCGIHFKEDFLDTVDNNHCSFWRDYNGTELSFDEKKAVWNWWFSMPADEIAHKHNLWIRADWQGFYKVPAGNPHGNEYAKVLGKKWDKMTEPEQRKFQKEWFKHLAELQKTNGILELALVDFANKYRLKKVTNAVKNFIKGYQSFSNGEYKKTEAEKSIERIMDKSRVPKGVTGSTGNHTVTGEKHYSGTSGTATVAKPEQFTWSETKLTLKKPVGIKNNPQRKVAKDEKIDAKLRQRIRKGKRK